MSFKRLDPDDFVVSAQSITATCWTGNVTALTQFFTQSNQVSSISGKYYTTVFNTSSAGDNREAQFQIAYGNENGGGARERRRERWRGQGRQRGARCIPVR